MRGSPEMIGDPQFGLLRAGLVNKIGPVTISKLETLGLIHRVALRSGCPAPFNH
jgi:hypothetical protein